MTSDLRICVITTKEIKTWIDKEHKRTGIPRSNIAAQLLADGYDKKMN